MFPQRIVQGFRLLVQGIGFGLFPGLAHFGRTHRYADLRALLLRASAGLTLLLAPLVVVACLVAGDLLRIVGGGAYRDAIPIARLLLVGLLVMPVSQFFGMALDAVGRSDLNMKKVGAMLAINVAGDLLVLTLGGSAPAVAAVTLVTLTGGAILGFRFLNRVIDIQPLSFLQFSLRGGRSILGNLRSARAS